MTMGHSARPAESPAAAWDLKGPFWPAAIGTVTKMATLALGDSVGCSVHSVLSWDCAYVQG